MKYFFKILILVVSMSYFSCAPDDQGEGQVEDASNEPGQMTEAPTDTTPVTVVYLKILGKENMLRGHYQEGQTVDDFIKTSSDDEDFEKLVNVDVKGSPFAEEYEEEGFKESESGAVESKMSVYNMLHVEEEDVDQPFRISVVTRVKDYKTWKWLYDMQEKNRNNAGMTQLQLGINQDDPNEVFMLLAIPDIAKAREMMHHPGLEAKMEESGVMGKPIVKFWRPAGPQSEEL